MSSSQTSIRDNDTIDAMETLTTQHDDTHKPEDPPASPRLPKKMRYDKSPDPPQKWTRERPGVSLIRMGKVRFHSPRPPPLTTLSDIISAHDGSNKTSDIKHQCHYEQPKGGDVD